MSRRNNNTPRSPLAVLVAVIILVIAAVIGQVIGVDPLVLLGINTPQATTAPATTAPPTGAPPTSAPGAVSTIQVGQGFGAEKGFWQVYFNAPTGSSDASTYVNGIDVPLANAIRAIPANGTLDIAAFEFNNEALTEAVVDAKRRGVTVRIVTDNEHGIGDTKDASWAQFQAVGIPIVDDNRGPLMHNKFMIINKTTVWTGSWNYTVNGTYRNNNNALVLRSRRAVDAYQAEFDEMFSRKEFGSRSTSGNGASFSQDGTPIEILFASEDDVTGAIEREVQSATKSIRFMAFVFSQFPLRDIVIQKASQGVLVQGIFEKRSSTATWSALPGLYCAGLQMRQDGNRYVLHHKVFIIDDETVITGSFNFSGNAADTNDENVVIVKDPDLAAQYIAEFNRRWAEAAVPEPGDIVC